MTAPPAEPDVYLVDLDGTTSLRNMDDPDVRGPYDWDRVGEDHPNEPIVTIVRTLAHAGGLIIYVTGRPEDCRAATSVWIAASIGVPGEALLMRAAGDHRPDEVVKRELYERWVKQLYRVTAVFDDRAKVVRMWRDDLGLTVLQVADGAF